MAKQNVNRILDAFITILEEDRKLPSGDPHKMDKKERMHVMDKIERIQLARGRNRVDLGPRLVEGKKQRKARVAHGLGHLTEPTAPVAPDPKADAFLKAVASGGQG